MLRTGLAKADAGVPPHDISQGVQHPDCTNVYFCFFFPSRPVMPLTRLPAGFWPAGLN